LQGVAEVRAKSALMRLVSCLLTMPKRLKRERRKGWRKPENAVIVDRTSRWGNPFRVCKEKNLWWIKDEDGNYWGEAGYTDYSAAAVKACQCYKGWIEGKIG